MRTPGLRQALAQLFEDFATDLHVALPGKVESYDSATQTANVKPMIQRIEHDSHDTRAADNFPVVPAVPVCWPRGGGYFLTFPLSAGDSGLLVFCESDIGAWRDSGQDSDPGDEVRHGIAGAVFVPGLETVARALPSDAVGDHAILGQEGGTQIHVDATGVKIGSATATHPIPKGDALIAWLSAHTHPVSGAVAGPSVLSTASINSTKHKVDA